MVKGLLRVPMGTANVILVVVEPAVNPEAQLRRPIEGDGAAETVATSAAMNGI